MKIPAIYKPARWRCVTPFEQEARSIGLAFDLAEGGTVRLLLDHRSAVAICEILREHLLVGVGLKPARVWSLPLETPPIDAATFDAHVRLAEEAYAQRLYDQWRVQLPISSGSPSTEVSPQDASHVCPPTRSSSAACGVR